jgi:hypothetical protein
LFVCLLVVVYAWGTWGRRLRFDLKELNHWM